MLNIGELARLTRTTTRTIRHYHAIGLMPEPPRSEGGYRQYDAGDLLRLLRIRRLASLGLALPRVAELLDASEEEADALLDRLDKELAAQMAILQEQRRVLAVLREHAVDPESPETFAPVLAALRRAGLPPAHLVQEREIMLLFSALGAESTLMEFYLDTEDEAVMRSYVEFMLSFDALRDLPPEDPAVDEAAKRMVSMMASWTDNLRKAEQRLPVPDLSPEAEKALSEYWLAHHSPAQRRALQLAANVVEEREATHAP